MHRSTLQIVADALRGDEQAAERVIVALAAHGLLRTDGPSVPNWQAGIYRTYLTSDAALEVETSGNVVLVTPERRITVTNVARWVESLTIARSTAQAAEPYPVSGS